MQYLKIKYVMGINAAKGVLLKNTKINEILKLQSFRM